MLPWLLGITLGAILGLALLIIIPRTLGGGHAAAATTESAKPAAEASAKAPAAAPADAKPAETKEPAASAGGATAATAGDATAGKEKFTATCAGCHGANAEGGVGPALKVAKDWTPEQFGAAVREGKAPTKTLSAVMPHFTTEQISDADLANIDAFVRTLN